MRHPLKGFPSATRRLKALKKLLKTRTSEQCDCEGACFHCNEFGHTDCWQRTSLRLRLWVLWKERGERNGVAS